MDYFKRVFVNSKSHLLGTGQILTRHKSTLAFPQLDHLLAGLAQTHPRLEEE